MVIENTHFHLLSTFLCMHKSRTEACYVPNEHALLELYCGTCTFGRSRVTTSNLPEVDFPAYRVYRASQNAPFFVGINLDQDW